MRFLLLTLFLVLLQIDQDFKVKSWEQEQNRNGHNLWYLQMLDLDVPIVINLAYGPV